MNIVKISMKLKNLKQHFPDILNPFEIQIYHQLKTMHEFKKILRKNMKRGNEIIETIFLIFGTRNRDGLIVLRFEIQKHFFHKMKMMNIFKKYITKPKIKDKYQKKLFTKSTD